MEQLIPFVKANLIESAAWVCLLVAIIYMTIKSKMSKVKRIVRGEAVNLINKEDAVVVDIRLHDAFKQGHISGSHHILPVDIKNGSLAGLDKYKDKPIIVVCATGTSAEEPANNLIKAGFERVYILNEGINGWNSENLPLVQGK